MPLSAQQIKEKLLSAIDQDANVVDMGHVLEAIHILEKTFIPKESLEETRLGKLVNDIRKKSADKEVTNRCRKLVRQWQKQHLKNSNGSSNSPKANQRTPPSSAVAILPAASSSPSPDAVPQQGGLPTQASVDKTNSANRKKRKIDTTSPSEGQHSSKLIKTGKSYADSSNGIPRDSSSRKTGVKQTSEVKRVGSVTSKKPSRAESPATKGTSSSPNVTSDNAKRKTKLKLSNAIPIAHGSRLSKSSPSLKKLESTRSPSLPISKTKSRQASSPKDSLSPSVSNIVKDSKQNNRVSSALVEDSPYKLKDRTSLTGSSKFICGNDSSTKSSTKSIFDDNASIFDDDHLNINDKSTKSDETLELGLPNSRLLSDDDDDDDNTGGVKDLTINRKCNQVCTDLVENSSLFSNDSSCNQNSTCADSSIDALRISPRVDKLSTESVLPSTTLKEMQEREFCKCEIASKEEPIRLVTEGEIERIHTTQWQGVNGCYDVDSQWHAWSDGYSIPLDRNEDDALHILPYVCLD